MSDLESAKSLFASALQAQTEGEWTLAEGLLRQALALVPARESILLNLSAVLIEQRRYDEPIQLCEAVLERNRESAIGWLNLGLAYLGKGCTSEAITAIDRSLGLEHNWAALLARAQALQAQGKTTESLESYRAAAMQSRSAQATCAYVEALVKQEQLSEALQICASALTRHPTEARLHNAHGNILLALARLEDAIASYQTALRMSPDHALVLCNLGNALTQTGRPEAALAALDQALQLQPDLLLARENKGHALAEMNLVDDALTEYEHCLREQPGRPDAYKLKANRAQLLLLKGDFSEGWRAYEYRRDVPENAHLRAHAQPLWLGQDKLHAKTLLVHAEQGLGDTLQFCRYLPLLQALRPKEVVFAVPDSLLGFLQQLPNVRCVSNNMPLPPHDLQCPLLSLPLALYATHPGIPSQTPYLHANQLHTERWRTSLPTGKPIVGLAWSGNPHLKNDRNRSMPLEHLLPLLDGCVAFVTLQKDVSSCDRLVLQDSDILDVSATLRDFDDTAGLVANCDLVVSVDTSIAHLAGALGKPLWVLLPFVPEWRWSLAIDRNPWYPSAKLFRQKERKIWSDVVAQVSVEMQALSRRQ